MLSDWLDVVLPIVLLALVVWDLRLTRKNARLQEQLLENDRDIYRRLGELAGREKEDA